MPTIIDREISWRVFKIRELFSQASYPATVSLLGLPVLLPSHSFSFLSMEPMHYFLKSYLARHNNFEKLEIWKPVAKETNANSCKETFKVNGINFSGSISPKLYLPDQCYMSSHFLECLDTKLTPSVRVYLNITCHETSQYIRVRDTGIGLSGWRKLPSAAVLLATSSLTMF